MQSLRSTLASTVSAEVERAPRQRASIPPRFRLREKLGEGGMGIVYRAYDVELGLEVAVKVLPRPSPEDLYHLKNEFRALARIRHPNLVDLHELFVYQHEACFSMELVPGSDFVDFVRHEKVCDYGRLRDAGRQLAQALQAVHEAGKLHRDIKPTNVRVSPAQRVVLLDFGLVDSLFAGSERTRASGALVGTLQYMAPEQARGAALTPAADWYGFGATLYEAVTGRVPLSNPMQWLLGDSARGPARVSDIVPDVPAEIDALIMGLLSPLPEQRPGPAETIHILTGRALSTASQTPPSPLLARGDAFENREDELRLLAQQHDRVRSDGGTIVAHVHGPSGIGKSELVRRFAEQVEAAGSVVLHGRCHPQESVTFNALDGLIDDLSSALSRLSHREDADALPPDSEVLAMLFPVLGSLTSRLLSPPAEPARETLKRAAHVLKQLLARISLQHPLVLWIDDVQWGDQDSGRLLRELLTPPDVPAALVVLSYRADDRRESPTLIALDEWHAANDTPAIDIPLAPLSSQQTVRLVTRLLHSEGRGEPAELEALARESNGIPFFVHELARHLIRLGPSQAAAHTMQLDDMLRSRVEDLPPDARAALEVVCVAGGPLEHAAVSLATGSSVSARKLLATLERASLVRTTAAGSTRRVEVYHDRIRETVLAGLPGPVRVRHHAAIAQSLLALSSNNLARVVEHFEAASDLDSVRCYIVAAAREAASVLAFDRAAALYRRAIEVATQDVAPEELHFRLATTLVEAGRGREAGAAFEAAAELCERARAHADRTIFLRRRAAEQYLQSGQWDRASRALGSIVGNLGIELPASHSLAIRQVLINRMRTSLLLPRLKPAWTDQQTAPTAVDRADLLMTLAMVYSFTDFVRAIAFSSQVLADALEVKHLRITMMGLALEAVGWASSPGRLARYQADRLLAAYARFVPHGDAFDRAGYHNAVGMTCWYRGQFREALDELDKAPAMFRAARRDPAFQIAMNHSYRYPALAHLGRLRTISADLEAQLADAEARGDNYFLAITAVGHQSLAWLAEDRVDKVVHWRERVQSILPAGFTVPQHMTVIAHVLSQLYEGHADQAVVCLESYWPELERSRLLMIPYFAADLLQLRARVQLARVEKRGSARARAQLKLALQLARKLERIELPYARAQAELIRAGAARLSGRDGDCTEALRSALVGLEAAGLELYAACARLALRPPGHQQAALQKLQAMGVLKPERMARVMVPGCLGPDCR